MKLDDLNKQQSYDELSAQLNDKKALRQKLVSLKHSVTVNSNRMQKLWRIIYWDNPLKQQYLDAQKCDGHPIKTSDFFAKHDPKNIELWNQYDTRAAHRDNMNKEIAHIELQLMD